MLSRPHALNPCDPDSLKFVAGLYDELLLCFRSRYVNVGCDETVELEDADGGTPLFSCSGHDCPASEDALRKKRL